MYYTLQTWTTAEKVLVKTGVFTVNFPPLPRFVVTYAIELRYLYAYIDRAINALTSRRLTGSGCCNSTRRVAQPLRTYTPQEQADNIARFFWNHRIHNRYRYLERNNIFGNYSSNNNLGEIMNAQEQAVNQWCQVYRSHQGAWADADMNAEIDRLADALRRHISALAGDISFDI